MTLVHDKAAVATSDDYIVRYWYRDSGLRQAAVRGAGSIGFGTNYYYDAALRLSTLASDLPFPGADVTIDLAYNPAGQIIRYSRSNDSYAWTGTVAVARDYETDGQNRYLRAVTGGVQSAAFGYDANGNLASETTPSAVRNYVYDIENRLVGAAGGGNVQLTYDPLGRLFQVSGSGGTTQFLYDGDALVAEYNGTGSQLKRYVHGPGPDEPVEVYTGSAQSLANRDYMLPDERGSIAALVNADGSPSVINTYDEYGIPGADNAGRFQYTGQIWIPELGMYYYKARIYSPTLGRFLQTDPIGYDDQINMYAYVGNDPINGVDPTGRRCESREGITTCTPEDKSFEPFSFETPAGWEDFSPSDPDFHDYPVDVAMGRGDDSYGELLNDELKRHPTPGEGSASPNGTLIDVDIPGPWGKDHVRSYSSEDSKGRPLIFNITQAHHTLASGFVIRQVLPDGQGGFTLRTYGEGNSWKQAGYFGNITRGGARTTWIDSARTIIGHARARRVGR